jgi:hypothetical protein
MNGGWHNLKKKLKKMNEWRVTQFEEKLKKLVRRGGRHK